MTKKIQYCFHISLTLDPNSESPEPFPTFTLFLEDPF
jgi:hypothetical protein